jgi:hypothetical protein
MSDVEKSEEGPQTGLRREELRPFPREFFFCDQEMNEEGRPITNT